MDKITLMDKKLEKLSKEPFSVEAARKYFESRKDLKKLFNVEYKGKDRQARFDISPISEYRWFIQLGCEYGVPRSLMLKSIQKFDKRFKDYNLVTFNLYCTRMFKMTPIESENDDRILGGGGG
ncbi:hypothetical protein OFO01_07430 [Campylobacter sp. JMF_01 NE2]|uniref:hypothetical protein n=1 Tax=Campylobacter sp. JMF_01 NE2 TaxID=2983832 RepID=UPI0022E9EF5C|nr:hypothetical protein [Campylobacter sp. JMF_01 NE2]MDA3067613.1 hypothetical protein [Campylobacter sp. JMF_01 NE2]